MRSITDKAWIHKYAGLSTDVKPVSDGRNVILNGSIFVEMDTSDVYMYDEEHLRWIKVNTSSSGGGGGEGASDAGSVSYDSSAAYSSGTVGKELNDLNRHLSDLDDEKQDAPSTAGTAGQVLGLDSNLNPAWMDQTGGGGGMNIVNLSGTQITQVGADNTMYMCGELTELTFTAPSVGITGIRFTSGTTPTVLTISGVTAWMFDFDPTSLEASTTYEINVLNGVGVVGWA